MMQYRSLTPLLPDSLRLGTVWETHVSEANERAYFAALNTLVVYKPEQGSEEEELRHYDFDEIIIKLLEWDGRVFVLERNAGLWEIRDDGLHPGPHAAFFSANNVHSVLNIPKGRIFCSYSNCFNYRPGQGEGEKAFIPFDTPAMDYLAEHTLGSAITLQDGSLLFSTFGGGMVHTDAQGNLIRILDTSNGLPTNRISGITEDQSGSVWAATVNGIVRLDFGLPLRRFDERSGIPDMPGRLTEHEDQLLFTQPDGIYRFNKEYQAEKIYSVSGCNSAFYSLPQTDELITLCGEKLYARQNGFFDLLEAEGNNGFSAVSLQQLSVDGREQPVLILLKSAMLYIIPAGSVAEIARGLAEEAWLYSVEVSDDLSSFVWDEHHSLWAGSDANGLFRIQFEVEKAEAEPAGFRIVEHRTSQHFTDLQNRANNYLLEVTELNAEPAFLTWGAGLQRYNYEKEQFEQITRYGDFFTDPERQFYRISEDENGNLWVRSDLQCMAALRQTGGMLAQNEQVSEDEQDGYFIFEGALRRITEYQNNDIYPDSRGFIWYATSQGLVRYDPQMEGVASYSRPPHVQISEILIRDQPLFDADSLDTEQLKAQDAITLDYRQNEMRFTFAANAYHEHEETEYRVRMEGFDEAWGPWTSEAFKDYTNIPEGTYDFKVQARDVYGQIEAAAPFSFTIRPPWQRTIWAYFLYVALGSGLLYLAFTIRLRQLTHVYRVRNRIASDLHDEISATLSSISYFAQAVERQQPEAGQQRFIKLISDSAGDAKEKISDIVWAINPEHDDWKAFLSKCRRFATDLLDSRGISHQIEITDHIPGHIDMQMRQHLWMIFKEMLTNAAWHSGASHVSVELRYSQGRLQLVVQDDGIGIDSQTLHGNGLHNIEKRAKAIGAALRFDSKTKDSALENETTGTHWELSVRL
jgi:ligand-binding sensor domain-containing protein